MVEVVEVGTAVGGTTVGGTAVSVKATVTVGGSVLVAVGAGVADSGANDVGVTGTAVAVDVSVGETAVSDGAGVSVGMVTAVSVIAATGGGVRGVGWAGAQAARQNNKMQTTIKPGCFMAQFLLAKNFNIRSARM